MATDSTSADVGHRIVEDAHLADAWRTACHAVGITPGVPGTIVGKDNAARAWVVGKRGPIEVTGYRVGLYLVHRVSAVWWVVHGPSGLRVRGRCPLTNHILSFVYRRSQALEIAAALPSIGAHWPLGLRDARGHDVAVTEAEAEPIFAAFVTAFLDS